MKSIFRAFSKDQNDPNEPTKKQTADNTQNDADKLSQKKSLPVENLNQNRNVFDSKYFDKQRGIASSGITDFQEFAERTDLKINPHPLFDTKFYCSQTKLDFKTSNEALQHYLHAGWKENLSPHPLFDPFFVAKQLPEDTGTRSALERFLNIDAKEVQPNPSFSKNFYEDQAGHRFESYASALEHYWLEGANCGLSPHPLFDSQFYSKQATELGLEIGEPLSHYLREGYRKGLEPHPLFDSKYYSTQESAALSEDYSPLVHYLVSGRKRASSPHPLFNLRIFNALEPTELFVQEIPALVRYLENANAHPNLDPNEDFDTEFYLENNSQLKASIKNPLAHYVMSKSSTTSFSPFYQPNNQKDLYDQFIEACSGTVIWNLVDDISQTENLKVLQAQDRTCTLISVSHTVKSYRRGLRKVKGITFDIICDDAHSPLRLCFDPASQMNQINQLFVDTNAAGILLHNFFSVGREQKELLINLRKPFAIHVGADFDNFINNETNIDDYLKINMERQAIADLSRDFKPHTFLNWKVSRKWFILKAQRFTTQTEKSAKFLRENFNGKKIEQIDFVKLLNEYGSYRTSNSSSRLATSPLRTLRIGVCASADASWTGGINYINNLLSALKEAGKSDGIDVKGVVLAEEGENVASFVSAIRECAELVQLKRICDDELPEAKLDCLFTAGNLFKSEVLPVVSWLYDFQHKEMPAFFTSTELDSRNSLFDQVSKHSKGIIVSSEHAKEIFSVYYPNEIHKVTALPFVPLLGNEAWTNSDSDYVGQKYNLPEKFFYLPNQFWIHKNFEVVIDALVLAKAQKLNITVVCTGSTNDSRDESYFPGILERVALEGLRDSFIILGMVPRQDVIALMRQSQGVLQPSLYEGWSTSVEECKALGLQIILSDLPVHREQDPQQAIYFEPFDANALLAAFVELHNSKSLQSRKIEELRLENREKFENFGKKALSVFTQAIT